MLAQPSFITNQHDDYHADSSPYSIEKESL